MVTFDPALVRWDYREHESYGRSCFLVYGGRMVSQNTCLNGMRGKFPMPDEGVMLKTSLVDTRWYTPSYLNQSEAEWVLWEYLPEPLRPDFQPVVSHGASILTDTLRISWTAQEWCPGRQVYEYEMADVQPLRDRARDHGVIPLDDGYYQCHRRPDGQIVWLDYGAFRLPGVVE